MIKKVANRIKFFLIIALSLSFIGGLVYYMQRPTDLYDFNDTRDLKQALKIIKNNRYWLFEETDKADPRWILENRTPYQGASEKIRGNLHIKVIRESGKLAGFVTYYKQDYYEGQIQFLVIDSKFRKKGYGQKLLQHAVNDLFAQGCQVVELQTRLNNVAAIPLYKKIGFKEINRDEDEGLIWFKVTKK